MLKHLEMAFLFYPLRTYLLKILILFNLDLFGKAKEKILKNDIVRKEDRRNVWDPQEIGLYIISAP